MARAPKKNQPDSFIIEIELGNDAMRRDSDVAVALIAVADRLRKGEHGGKIRDLNGNSVGHFSFRGN